MKLYDRDYTQLSHEEEAEWQLLRQQEIVRTNGKFVLRKSNFRKYPKAARHFMSSFPNNYLDIVELQDNTLLRTTIESFRQLLDLELATERKILNFIIDNHAYFIIASLLKSHFRFGHHEAYLFPEFQLGNSYKADHLLVGKNSGGWHFVFVELEAPTGNITLANGELGNAFRKGLAQVSEWNIWLEARYSALSETFEKHKRADAVLPQEFYQLDKSRIHYVVIAGRRTDFTEKTYRLQRKRQMESAELVLHYDNLLDSAENVIGQNTY